MDIRGLTLHEGLLSATDLLYVGVNPSSPGGDRRIEALTLSVALLTLGSAEDLAIGGEWSFSNALLTGGSIDGTPIGAEEPSSGAFTTLTASGGITGTLVGGGVPASLVSAGAFGEGAYVFPSTLDVGNGATASRELEVYGTGNVYIRINAASGSSPRLEFNEIDGRMYSVGVDGATDAFQVVSPSGVDFSISSARLATLAGGLTVAGAVSGVTTLGTTSDLTVGGNIYLSHADPVMYWSGTSGDYGKVSWTEGDPDAWKWQYYQNSSLISGFGFTSTSEATGDGWFYVAAAGTERLRVNASGISVTGAVSTTGLATLNSLTVTGATTLNSTLGVNNTLTITGSSSGNAYIISSGGTSSNLYFGDADNDVGSIRYFHSDDTIRFTAGTVTPLTLSATTLTGTGNWSTTGTLASGDHTLSGGASPKLIIKGTSTSATEAGEILFASNNDVADTRIRIVNDESANVLRFDVRNVGTDGWTTGMALVRQTSGLGSLVLGTTPTSSNAQFYATKTYSNSSGWDYPVFVSYAQSVATTGGLNAIRAQARSTHTSGAVADMIGLRGAAYAEGAGGTTTNLIGLYSDVRNSNASAVVTNGYGLYIGAFTATGSITNRWGIYQAGASERNYFAGSTLVGTTTNVEGVVQLFGVGGLNSSGYTSTISIRSGYGYSNSNHGIGFAIGDRVASAGIYISEFGGAGSNMIFTTATNYATPTMVEAMRIASTGIVTVKSDLALTTGSITSASGAISFGDENLTTTGTLASGALTISQDVADIVNINRGGTTNVWAIRLNSGGLSFRDNSATGAGAIRYTISSAGHHDFASGNITTLGTASTGALTVTGTGSFTVATGVAFTASTTSASSFTQSRVLNSVGTGLKFTSYGSTYASGTSFSVGAGGTSIASDGNLAISSSETFVRMGVGSAYELELTDGAVSVTGTLGVSSYVEGTTTNGYLDLRGDSGATLGMRLFDTGNLSIGSNTDNYKLTVTSTANRLGVLSDQQTSSSSAKYGYAAQVSGALGTGINYGVFSATSASGGSTNYAGYFNASGATTNYGVYSAGGTNYFNGNVLIGTTSDSGSKLQVNGAVTFSSTLAISGPIAQGGATNSGESIASKAVGHTLSGSYKVLAKFQSTEGSGYGIRLGHNGSNGVISGIGQSGLSFWTYDGSAWGERFSITNAGVATFQKSLNMASGANFVLGGSTLAASATNTLHIYNGTPPSESVADGVLLYSEDVSGSAELKVRDEGSNITTLSPHNRSLLQDCREEFMSWTYYSENRGFAVNADIMYALRVLEDLSGQKLIWIKDIAGTTEGKFVDRLPKPGRFMMIEKKVESLEKANIKLRKEVTALQQRIHVLEGAN